MTGSLCIAPEAESVPTLLLHTGQEDQEREAEAKTLEATRYQREIEQAQKEAFAEKQRRRAGFLVEQVGSAVTRHPLSCTSLSHACSAGSAVLQVCASSEWQGVHLSACSRAPASQRRMEELLPVLGTEGACLRGAGAHSEGGAGPQGDGADTGRPAIRGRAQEGRDGDYPFTHASHMARCFDSAESWGTTPCRLHLTTWALWLTQMRETYAAACKAAPEARTHRTHACNRGAGQLPCTDRWPRIEVSLHRCVGVCSKSGMSSGRWPSWSGRRRRA